MFLRSNVFLIKLGMKEHQITFWPILSPKLNENEEILAQGIMARVLHALQIRHWLVYPTLIPRR